MNRSDALLALSVASGCLALAAPAAASTANGASTMTLTLAAGCDLQVGTDLAFATPAVGIGSNNITVSAVTGQGQVNIVCSNGTAYKFFAPLGANGSGTQRKMLLSSGAYYVNYAISAVSSGGSVVPLTAATATAAPYARTGTGALETIAIYGQVPAQTVATSAGANASNPPAGTFTDTITFTVSF